MNTEKKPDAVALDEMAKVMRSVDQWTDPECGDLIAEKLVETGRTVDRPVAFAALIVLDDESRRGDAQRAWEAFTEQFDGKNTSLRYVSRFEPIPYGEEYNASDVLNAFGPGGGDRPAETVEAGDMGTSDGLGGESVSVGTKQVFTVDVADREDGFYVFADINQRDRFEAAVRLAGGDCNTDEIEIGERITAALIEAELDTLSKGERLTRELAHECGYDENGDCPADALIDYKDALEDRLRSLVDDQEERGELR